MPPIPGMPMPPMPPMPGMPMPPVPPIPGMFQGIPPTLPAQPGFFPGVGPHFNMLANPPPVPPHLHGFPGNPKTHDLATGLHTNSGPNSGAEITSTTTLPQSVMPPPRALYPDNASTDLMRASSSNENTVLKTSPTDSVSNAFAQRDHEDSGHNNNNNISNSNQPQLSDVGMKKPEPSFPSTTETKKSAPRPLGALLPAKATEPVEDATVAPAPPPTVVGNLLASSKENCWDSVKVRELVVVISFHLFEGP